MSLPNSWVERIWAAMRATYGAEFDRQWETPAGADPAEHVRQLKGFWARDLGPYVNAPEAIRHALENLPARAPNLIEFRAICRMAPPKPAPALPAPVADPARVAAVLAGITKPQPTGLSPAALCVEKLRTFAARNDQRMTASQRHVMKSCEVMLGLAKATEDQ